MNDEPNAPSESSAAHGQSPLYVYFRVCSRRFRMPAAEVERVADVGQLNGLPRLPTVVLGICSDRGRVLTVMDAARLLDVAQVENERGVPRLLVLKAPGSGLALRVDAVESIQTSESEISTAGTDASQGDLNAVELSTQLLLTRLEGLSQQDNW